MLNVIDLFCGCGGLSHGFGLAGFNTVCGVDNNKHAIETFKWNHPDSIALCEDITQLSGHSIAESVGSREIHAIVGGPPCQGLSLSGPRRFDDPRNKLYLSFIRLVDEIRPECFLIENVPGILSLYGGAIRENIVERLSSLGYTVTFALLNAADYGVPQVRKRVFFIGLKGSRKFEFPEPTHPDEAFWLTAEEAISDLPLLEDEQSSTEYASAPQNEYQRYCRRNSSQIRNHEPTRHSEKTKSIISLVPEGQNFRSLPDELRHTRKFNVAWTRYHSKKPAPTIDTGHRHHFHFNANRVPTVRENARFQSFQDCFVFSGNKGEQYKQVGNAVPPLLAKALAERLATYIMGDE